MSLSALPTVLLGTVLAFPILEHFAQWHQGNEVLDQRLWTPRYRGRPQPLRGDLLPQLRSKHASGNKGTPWTLRLLVSSWMFLGSLFLFFREPTRWEKRQRSIYLSEEIPKVVVPRKRTDLVKQCTRGVLRKKQGVLLFNRNQCFFPSSWCPWCGERLRAGGEGGDRGWDGWMASPTQCTWVWASSGKWCGTWKPGARGIRRVGRGLSTEQQYHFNGNVLVFAVCAETPPSGQPFPTAAQLPTLWVWLHGSACQPVFLFLACFLPPSDELIFPLSPFFQNLLKLV